MYIFYQQKLLLQCRVKSLKEFKHLARHRMQNTTKYLRLDANAYRRRVPGMMHIETLTYRSIRSNTLTINTFIWTRYRQDEVFVMNRNSILLQKENRNINALYMVKQAKFIFVCTLKDVVLNNPTNITEELIIPLK